MRSQFTFYESFASALDRIKKKTDKVDAYDAIIHYALYGTEPDMEKLPDSAAIAFELIRPNLDASKRKADNGKRGGVSKQTASKAEANAKQTASEKEKENEIEKEKENEIEIENECYPPTSLPTPQEASVASVLADYLSRINPAASPGSLDELRAFAEAMGEAVCKRAFDIALDSKKTTWPYIRAILQDKQRRGVKCLADWDALGDSRETPGKSTAQQMSDDAWKYV